MTIPACLPLLASRPVPAARDAGAEARQQGKRFGGFHPAPPPRELPDDEWAGASAALFDTLPHLADRDDLPDRFLDLARPAGLRLALAVLSLAAESAEDLALLVGRLEFQVAHSPRKFPDRPLGGGAVRWALLGDAYRRLGKPEHAEAAFGHAFSDLGPRTDALAFAKVEVLYAQRERERGALDAAIEGFARALAAFEAAGARSAALDTAVRLASALCEAGRAQEAEGVCARVRFSNPGPMLGSCLAREGAYLAARGRDAAAGRIERIAGEAWMGWVPESECRDLADLRFARLAERFPHFGPGSAAHAVAVATERSYADWCRAQLLFGLSEARSLRTLARLQQSRKRKLPADIAAALVYFVGSTAAPARSAGSVAQDH